jgi:GT2 family glycosyltransferase
MICMNSPKVSVHIGVVTVLYKSEAVLPEFFASLFSQSYKSFTVFAIDNASNDRSASICRDTGICTVIDNAVNLGVAAGNNQGIIAALAAGCEYILLLNNDVRFGPELFAQLIAGLPTHNCDMTTPMMYFNDQPDTIWCAGGGFQPWIGLRQRHYAEGARDSGQHITPRRVDFTPTCCVLMHHSVFKRVGLMDERYFVYWDDTDWMLRAHRAGLSLYLLPQAKLWHKLGASTGRQSAFTLHYSTRNHAYYIRKHLPFTLAAIWTAIYCMYYAIGAVFSHRSRSKLRAWREGWRMLQD